MILCLSKTAHQLTNTFLQEKKNNQFNKNELESITKDNEITFDSWKEIIENASK